MAAGQFQDAAIAAANKYGVPVDMFLWQIGQESGWDPNAKNPNSSATGIAQFTKDTADTFKINPLDPMQSLDAAAKYDAQLLNKWGNWKTALTKYGTLDNADTKTLNAFENALNGKAPASFAEAKAYYDNHGYAYTPPAASGSVAEKFQTATKDIGDTFIKYLSTGTFIVLGVVIIALAVLSNKTVRSVATKGAM